MLSFVEYFSSKTLLLPIYFPLMQRYELLKYPFERCITSALGLGPQRGFLDILTDFLVSRRTEIGPELQPNFHYISPDRTRRGEILGICCESDEISCLSAGKLKRLKVGNPHQRTANIRTLNSQSCKHLPSINNIQRSFQPFNECLQPN